MTMSTYLVAFIVGPLTFTEEVDANGVPLRVACVPGKEHLGQFALDIGEHSLNFFADFFGIPYPSFKLDLVALPDFAFGAMENLGCVTFRETALLVDPSTASTTELMRIADVVAHEIAHMWFGDLVTMKWWNGIWLNEAFATFMEMLCADSFRPKWKRWDQFATERAASMKVDGLQLDTADRDHRRAPRRGRRDVRRADLRKGRVDRAHARAVPRRREVPRRPAALHEDATRTGTPRPPTCGTRSRKRAASRPARSWTPGSTRAATRW